MLYPKRGPKNEYYRPDFYLLNKDKKKRGFTKYRAWQKYCHVAQREGYKAYGKSWFYKLYKDYFGFYIPPRVRRSENMRQIRLFTIWKESYSDVIEYSDEARARLEAQIDEWCKKDDWIRIGFGMILIVGHYWTGLTKCKDQYASKIMNPPSDTLLYGNKWRCTV